MTRILHVTECFSTGVSRAIRTIAQLAPEHEHHLLYTGLDEPGESTFASCRELPDGTSARIRAVREVAGALGADVVHAHSSWAGVYTRALPLSARVVYQPHGYKLSDTSASRPARFAVAAAESLLGLRSDAVVVLSPQEARLARRLTPRAQVVVVPNVPTLPVREGSPESSEAPQGGGEMAHPTIVMSGRVSRQKDPEWFVAAVELVRRERPDVRAVWLGSDDDKGLTERLMAADVTVTGWVDADEVRRLVGAAGVYLHTARYEGFPLSVLDALALGTPTLVRDIPAFEGTPLWAVDSPAVAADRALALLTSREQREANRRAGAQLLTTMSPDAQQAALAELYG